MTAVRRCFLVSLLVPIISVNSVVAQASRPGLEVAVKSGLVLVTQDLGFGMGTERDPNVSLGLAIDVRTPMRVLGFRAGLEYIPSYEISIPGIVLHCDFRGPGRLCPADATRVWTENDLLAFVGDIVLRGPRLGDAQLQTELIAGAGVKRYSGTAFGEVPALGGGEEVDFTLHLGAGLRREIGDRTSVRVELGDYISWFRLAEFDPREVQHDISASVAFGLRLLQLP